MSNTIHLNSKPARPIIHVVTVSGNYLANFKRERTTDETIALANELKSKIRVQAEFLQLNQVSENTNKVEYKLIIKSSNENDINLIINNLNNLFGGVKLISTSKEEPTTSYHAIVQSVPAQLNENEEFERLNTQFKIRSFKRSPYATENQIKVNCTAEFNNAEAFYLICCDGIYFGNQLSKCSPYYKKPKICSNCTSYGHYFSNCQQPVPTCIVCGGTHHYSMCIAENPKCVHCQLKNTRENTTNSTNHYPFEANCPIYNDEFKNLNIKFITEDEFKNLNNTVNTRMDEFSITMKQLLHQIIRQNNSLIINNQHQAHMFQFAFNHQPGEQNTQTRSKSESNLQNVNANQKNSTTYKVTIYTKART